MRVKRDFVVDIAPLTHARALNKIRQTPTTKSCILDGAVASRILTMLLGSGSASAVWVRRHQKLLQQALMSVCKALARSELLHPCRWHMWEFLKLPPSPHCQCRSSSRFQ